MTATRQPVWRSGDESGWHPDLVWYAAAIHQMKLLTPELDEFLRILDEALAEAAVTGQIPAVLVSRMAAISAQWDDPLSLGYQSQVHGTFVPKSRWPQIGGTTVLWRECAHNHWFFLPWHRAYLVEFEIVVRTHIARLGGPASDWGLPYWNYSDYRGDPRRLGLPLPLRGSTLPVGVDVPGVDSRPDGSFPNPLFIPVREIQENRPDDGSWADATDALLRPHFANQQDTRLVSFGGGVIETPNDPALFHGEARERGLVDNQPHGVVHGHVGGAMGLFQTAGLDPVFWLHHCNVDRLWETYAQDLNHDYPFTNGVGLGTPAHRSWTNQEFRFLRPDGTTATWRAPGVLDVLALGYRYDTTAPPPLPPSPRPPIGSEIDPFGLDAPVPIPEPIAEATSIALGETSDVPLSSGAASPEDVPVEAFPEGTQWLLRLDGIHSRRPTPTSYHVYLGLDDDAPADPQDSIHHVGVLSMFGAWEASGMDDASSDDGQRQVFDATAQVQSQAATLRPMATTVRLVALDRERPLAAAGMSIDRVSLEFVSG